MKRILTPVGTMGTDIDAIVPGTIVEISLDADTPLAFPPADDFPAGGRTSIRVPAGANVELRRTAGGDGYRLDPGHWDLAFWKPEECFLVAVGAAADIAVLGHREN